MEYRGLTLDPFQEKAIRALASGHSVLVCAPTGTGKTIIADWIVEEALRTGKRVVYTAPIKALSNQKFRDYVRLYGEERVGLVTGDLVIRRDAPCLVMTTEILRNMLLNNDPIPDLLAVVIDEIHFLDDRERGTVWEEVLIYLPHEVAVVGLSATLSNQKEFASWLEHVRGSRFEVVTETRRAVPLHTHYLSTDTGLVDPEKFDRLFHRRRPTRSRGREGRRGDRGDGRRGAGGQKTSHLDVFRTLRDQDLLPYLYFVFSRRDTEVLARGLGRVMRDGLLDDEAAERSRIRLDRAARELGPVLDDDLRELYSRGIAYHHAGLHVQLKGLVEELYEERLLQVLYCTSTFALGINMPARSVVFDGLKKYDGRSLAPLTTRGFMQKAGRAGRRGMDDEGHVVIRMDLEEYPELKPVLARYAKGAYEPVRSSFNLSFHSIVNLLEHHDLARIREIVEKSFLSWHLAARARQADEDTGSGRRNRREATRCWDEFQRKVRYLTDVGYLSADGTFNAGARVLRNLQISEVLVTELVLAGVLEDLDGPRLFGVLCGLTNSLPRHVRPAFRPRPEDKVLARTIERLRWSDVVTAADELAGTESQWDPDVMVLGRAWAEGKPLLEILEMIHSDTDVSGDLITGFRRAKDLTGQLRDVYRDLPDRARLLSDLIRSVGRDEVEVVG